MSTGLKAFSPNSPRRYDMWKTLCLNSSSNYQPGHLAVGQYLTQGIFHSCSTAPHHAQQAADLQDR